MTSLEQLSNDRKEVLTRILEGSAEETDYKLLFHYNKRIYDMEVNKLRYGQKGHKLRINTQAVRYT